LSRELIEQRRANVPGSEHADRERLARQVKSGVRRAKCSLRIATVDDNGDVALRRALRDE